MMRFAHPDAPDTLRTDSAVRIIMLTLTFYYQKNMDEPLTQITITPEVRDGRPVLGVHESTGHVMYMSHEFGERYRAEQASKKPTSAP